MSIYLDDRTSSLVCDILFHSKLANSALAHLDVSLPTYLHNYNRVVAFAAYAVSKTRLSRRPCLDPGREA